MLSRVSLAFLAPLALALAALPLAAAAGELEDLADKYFETGRFEQALSYYRKAIAANPKKDALWGKYDTALTALLLSRGVIQKQQAAPGPSVAATPVATAASPAAVPATAPATQPPVVAPPAGPPAVGGAPPAGELAPSARRPGEKIPMPDPALMSQGTGSEPIDGGWYRIEDVRVAYDKRGVVILTGKLSNTGEQPITRPLVYASIFDQQGGLRGHASGSLARGVYFLGQGNSEAFEITVIPTSKVELAFFSVEVVATH